MAWKGVTPLVKLVCGTYEKGVKVLPELLSRYQACWHPSEALPKWDITITPG
jgi:hypothetical protein